ncbi:hypothetical protein PENSPDRAFT_681884 [Peniophora sp. CONT]|nr:hypothetical protein PENSPDRAFT_681884 [Peniophora sp. CONT]
MAPNLAPHQVYSEELASAFRRGHPIAVPHPGVRDGQVSRAVGIGDVGYIHPSGGDFVRLFNVHLEPGADGQPILDDLPEGFSCLPLRETRRVPNETPIWLSKTVTRKRLGVDVSGPFFGGSVEFESSANRGAVLVTPDPIYWIDALHILSYKEYTQGNIENWLEYARNHGHDISLEDIILVTGVDLTTSWATAVFNDARLEAGFGLDVQFSGSSAGLHLACQYSWQSTSSALVNSGPAPTRPRPLGDPTSPLSPPFLAPSGPNSGNTAIGNLERPPLNTTQNQALFVRHIRAKRRRLWRGLKLEARGESDDTDDSDESTDTEGSDVVMDDIVIVSNPRRKKFTDILDSVLDHILENSNSNIAIAHDEDLDLLPGSTAAQSLGPVIRVQDGIGMFQDNHLAPSSFSRSEGPHMSTSTAAVPAFPSDEARTSQGKAGHELSPPQHNPGVAVAESYTSALPNRSHPRSTNDKSRRRAPAACTPCRKRHVRCIWTPSEGSPVRCQRCSERDLNCVYEPTTMTIPPPTTLVVPLHGHASSHNMGSSSAPSRGPRHAETHPDHQPHLNVSNSPIQQDQPDNVFWNSRSLLAGAPFGHSPSQSQGPTTYFGSGTWRVPGTPSLTLQSSPYNPNHPVQQTNGTPYQSPFGSTWSTSPYSTADPSADSFYNLLSQSPEHPSDQSPPMLDPPSRN